jgi:hypothetical protein
MELVAPAVIVAVALGAGAWWWLRRRREDPVVLESPPVAMPDPPAEIQGQPMRPLLCPTCGGQYPPGLSFCPLDARALVQNSEWSVGTVVQVTCRACHRTFEPNTRFCPFDAQELVPLPALGSPVSVVPLPGLRGGKICPRCNERFGGGESFCGRDGSELVTLN